MDAFKHFETFYVNYSDNFYHLTLFITPYFSIGCDERQAPFRSYSSLACCYHRSFTPCRHHTTSLTFTVAQSINIIHDQMIQLVHS